jgi:hypothetical protein
MPLEYPRRDQAPVRPVPSAAGWKARLSSTLQRSASPWLMRRTAGKSVRRAATPRWSHIPHRMAGSPGAVRMVRGNECCFRLSGRRPRPPRRRNLLAGELSPATNHDFVVHFGRQSHRAVPPVTAWLPPVTAWLPTIAAWLPTIAACNRMYCYYHSLVWHEPKDIPYGDIRRPVQPRRHLHGRARRGGAVVQYPSTDRCFALQLAAPFLMQAAPGSSVPCPSLPGDSAGWPALSPDQLIPI